MSTERRVRIEPQAMPNMGGSQWQQYLLWPGDLDDLVRFIYANQGPLFAEDAVLFDYNGELILKRDPGLRIRASWEIELPDPPSERSHAVILNDEQIAALDTMIEDDAERMYAQQRATNDYTINDLRRAMNLRDSIRTALHPQRPQ